MLSEITSERVFSRDRLLAGGGAALLGSFVTAGVAAESVSAAPFALPMKNDLLVHDGTTFSPLPMGIFNVRNYGAKGDGVTNDAPAFQACFDAARNAGSTGAGAKVLIPPPASAYILTDTVYIQPSAYTQFRMDIEAYLPWYGIEWRGASNASVFRVHGLKDSTISGMNVHVRQSKNDVTIWDIGEDPLHSPPILSTGRLTFRDCFASCDGDGLGNPQSNIVGYRLGHYGTTDTSQITFMGCTMSASDRTKGHKGWVSENQNVLGLTLITCGGTGLTRFYTNVPTAGSANSNGGDAATFIGCLTSGNRCDFECRFGNHTVIGGRYETGQRFFQSENNSSPSQFCMYGVEIGGYDPAPNSDWPPNFKTLFVVANPTSLQLDSCIVYNVGLGSPYELDQNMFYLSGAVGPYALSVRNCAFMASDPFYTIAGTGECDVEIANCRRINSSTNPTAKFASPNTRLRTKTTNYTVLAGDKVVIMDATLSALTATLPTAVGGIGREYTIKRKNSNANAVTVATTSSQTIDGATTVTLSNPWDSITVVSDGANWIRVK